MTPLTKTVRRRVPAARRDLVVALELSAGEALVSVREAGRRVGYSITVGGLFMILAKRAADAAVEQRKIARKAKRSAR